MEFTQNPSPLAKHVLGQFIAMAVLAVTGQRDPGRARPSSSKLTRPFETSSVSHLLTTSDFPELRSTKIYLQFKDKIQIDPVSTTRRQLGTTTGLEPEASLIVSDDSKVKASKDA